MLNLRYFMAKQGSKTSNLGLYVYGGAAIFLGLLGLVSADFATTWQNVGPNIPLRVALAYLTAVIELAGGIALLLPRTARAGALTLTIVYSVFTLIWVPKAFVNLDNYDPIGNVFEEFSLVAAGLVLCAIFSPAGSSIARRRPFFVLSSVFAPFPSASSTSLTCPACWAGSRVGCRRQRCSGPMPPPWAFSGPP
jgi:uncharacterized membrane protein YphA (DoxX/SURF4 family)